MRRWTYILIALALFATRTAIAGPNEGLALEPTIDRSTPRRALAGFMHAAERGDWEVAEHYLDLRTIPPAKQETEGPILAEKLGYVLEHSPGISADRVPDQADTPSPLGQGVIAATIDLGDEPVPIALVRVKYHDGVERWIFARSTVAMTNALYDAMGKSPWEDAIPARFKHVELFGNALWQWMGLALAFPLAYALSKIVLLVFAAGARRLLRRAKAAAAESLLRAWRRPLVMFLTVLVLRTLITPLRLTLATLVWVDHITFTLLVISMTWFLIASLAPMSQWIDEGLPVDGDEFSVRGTRTRLAVLERVVTVLLMFVMIAIVLLQFQRVRSVGVSLLASAGIAGVIVGVAAQRSIGAIIAGIQISMTQPIRIGDHIFLEGEFGTVEKVFLTYAVIRLWDERSLIVPIGRFLESPFQNWTYVTQELTGIVPLQVDFMLPVERVRIELERICDGSPLWDRRKCSLLVTDAAGTTMTIRALVTARNADDLFGLRCHVRERLIAFLRELDGGRYFTRTRNEDVARGTS